MPDSIDLLDDQWVLSSGDSIREQGTLPASALQILCKSNVIKHDPLHRFGEQEVHWVSERTWKFERHFEVTNALLSHHNVDLLLTGLDTVAQVLVNGTKVLKADNAFRSFVIPAKRFLKPGRNQLEIIIQPASDVARARYAAHPYKIPAVQQTPAEVFGGEKERYNFVRKPACDFGWDWGPSFSQAGVYGPISLSGYSYTHLTGINVRQEEAPAGGKLLNIICQLRADERAAGGKLSATLADFNCSAEVVVPQGDVPHQVALQLAVPPDASLWWPTGYGAPTLHDLHVTFIADSAVLASDVDDASTNRTGDKQKKKQATAELRQSDDTLTDRLTDDRQTDRDSEAARSSLVRKRIGLKTVKLITEPLPDGGGIGETFSFEVNGVPIWIKGSNMIPSSIYVTEETAERQRSLVDAAAASHQNTLRVWGGGRYPTTAFMEACDEAGMLVWLELMFACALYPADTAFIENVGEEVRQQMFRLQDHACVLVLGGNNEVENSFGWFPDTSACNPSLYAVDFSRLFVDAIRPIVKETGPDIYLDTSPSNGVWSTEPYEKRWDADSENKAGTNDPRWGDVHFYDYKADGLDPQSYPRAKFVSEFGWQSWPSWPGLKKCIDTREDCSWDSKMSYYRQRHPDGQEELKQQLERHFPIGCAMDKSERGFRRWIYLTQLHQAMAYDTAIRHWRQLKSEPDACTMGSLYWQLNDIWEGASWSSLNHDGSWKLLHYVISRAYAPLIVSLEIVPECGQLSVFLVSDSMHVLEGEVTVEVIPWWATEEIDSTVMKQAEFEVQPRGVHIVMLAHVLGLLSYLEIDREDAFIRVSAESRGPTDGAEPQQVGQPYRSTAIHHLTKLKNAALRQSVLSAKNFVQDSPTQVTFEVHVTAVTAGLALETDLPGRFSDNVSHVLPWQPLSVTFYSASSHVSAASLESSLTMQSLCDDK